MDPVALGLLALLVGAAVGVGATLLIVYMVREAQRLRDRYDAIVPAGVLDVLQAMDSPAAVVDGSLTAVAASPAARVLGLEPGEVIVIEDLRVLVRRARSEGAAQTARFRIRRAGSTAASSSREARPVVARASVLDAKHVLLVVDDVTEQEKFEQARYDFVANTSHELKTPVGAVRLLAEAIESAADDPEHVRVFAQRLQAEADRLGRLTGRIMDLSRLQSADELPAPQDVSIDEVVTAAIEANAVQAESAGVNLVRGGSRGAIVRGDSSMLVDAVGNLVANALTYSAAGSRVAVGVRADDDCVEIAVTDQGAGIPEDDQARIFERFFRSDAARSRRTGGTGLGLAIVSHVVQRHGGDVRVWSRVGLGSTFTIRLPRATAPAAAEPGSPKAGKKRALAKKAERAAQRRARAAGSPSKSSARGRSGSSPPDGPAAAQAAEPDASTGASPAASHATSQGDEE